MKDKELIFILSLPRSGSTLLQRILAAHDDIDTVSEPHILLPLIYSLKEHGVYAEYDHDHVRRAIIEFCEELPNGQDDYFAEIRDCALRLYIKASHSKARYFLDKTPRYCLIADDLVRLFPEAKFVFLWRNPLSVISSLMKTYEGGKYVLYRFKKEIFDGLDQLISTYEEHINLVHAVQYENMIRNSEDELQKLFNFLELPFTSELLLNFTQVQLKGRFRDEKMMHYKQVSEEPMQKWKKVLNNPVRKAWARHYLHWIGEKRLALMGYDMKSLISELDGVSLTYKFAASDLLRMWYGIATSFVEPWQFKDKLRLLPNLNKITRYR